MNETKDSAWLGAKAASSAGTAGDGVHLAGLHARLSEEAEMNGVFDVAYRTIDSPVGPLLLAATPMGVVRVAFVRDGEGAALESISAQVSARILRGGPRLDAPAREIDEFFEGQRRQFDVALDFQLAHGFRRAVLTQLQQIGYGSTAGYGAIARAAGSPKAVRAVGTACATNPLPILVPCHRVVRSDGSLGGYAGGIEAKQFLLALERGA